MNPLMGAQNSLTVRGLAAGRAAQPRQDRDTVFEGGRTTCGSKPDVMKRRKQILERWPHTVADNPRTLGHTLTPTSKGRGSLEGGIKKKDYEKVYVKGDREGAGE